MADSNKDIKALISKLNDRAIQAKRESGLTRYVIYGVIGYLILSLVQTSYILNINKYGVDVFNSILASYFFAYSIYRIIDIYTAVVNSETEPLIIINSEINFAPHVENYAVVYWFFPATFSLINYLSYEVFFNLLIFILFVLVILFYYLIRGRYSSKSNIKLKPIQAFPFAWSSSRPAILLMMILTLVSIYFLYQFHKGITHDNFVTAIVFGGQFMILLVAIGYIIDYEKDDAISRFLRKLEIRLFTGKITEDEANQKLTQNVIGVPLESYLDDLGNNLVHFVEERLIGLEEATGKLNNMDLTDMRRLADNLILVVSTLEQQEKRTREIINKKKEISEILQGVVFQLQRSKRIDEISSVKDWMTFANQQMSQIEAYNKNILKLVEEGKGKLESMQQPT